MPGDDMVEDVNAYKGILDKQNTIKTDFNDYAEESNMKHDRTEQLMASNAFDNMVDQSQSTFSKKKSFSRLTSGKKIGMKRGSMTNVNKSTRISSPKKMT
jgi:hypothetical protein